MRLSPSDVHTYYRPSECALRIYLREHNEPEAPASPYEQVLERLGQRHEKAHLATFPVFVDLSEGTLDEREHRTKEEVGKAGAVIYQPALRAVAALNGKDCHIVGTPDFLLPTADGYAVRDSKISRRITERDHPEILRQMELYGWLYERTFGRPPRALQVHAGTGELIDIVYDGGVRALSLLGEVLTLKEATSEPYSAVGWTKCGDCGFHGRCWTGAEQNHNIATVPGVDQGLAATLHQAGVNSIKDFIEQFDETRLAALKRPVGTKLQRVGKSAGSILRSAHAMATNTETVTANPRIPAFPNYVMFDVEGLPPQLDELDKTYLWGLQAFGEKPSPYLPATADFGPDGERAGWEKFLDQANGLFREYGGLPFIHWHHYERVRLDTCVQRYGDPHGVAQRIRQNLLDLFPVTRDSIALPLPSYSLKVIEAYVGFNRSQDEYGGQWAMAKYIEATETNDQALRASVMGQILAYNREDLEATWAVLQWLRTKRLP